MRYFGIDVHPATLRLTLLQEDGKTETMRYDNTVPGREELATLVRAEPAVVAIGAAAGAEALRQELQGAAERVLLVTPTEIFSTFPELGKKTLNLARLAHRVVHDGKVDQLLRQSIEELKRLVDRHRAEVEVALHEHLGDFAERPTLWTDAGQEWLETTLPTLPDAVRARVVEEMRRINVLCQDSLEIDALTRPE